MKSSSRQVVATRVIRKDEDVRALPRMPVLVLTAAVISALLLLLLRSGGAV